MKGSPSGAAYLDPANSRTPSPSLLQTSVEKERRWIISYQRGEIVSLLRRVAELEQRLKRRSIVLLGALALLGLVGATSTVVWISQSRPEPANMALPLRAETRTAGVPNPWVSVAERLRSENADNTASNLALTATAPVARLASPPPDPIVAEQLPVNAPIHVTVNFPRDDQNAEQLAMMLVQHLRDRGQSVSDPSAILRQPTKAGITYFFDEDHDGAVAVESILGGLLGKSRLASRPQADPAPRPGSVVVMVPSH